MKLSTFILVCFIFVNLIPVEHSWKAECVWCAMTHDQPIFFEGHSVGFPFHWRTYGVFRYESDSKFEDIMHWGDLVANLCLTMGIYVVSHALERVNKIKELERARLRGCESEI